MEGRGREGSGERGTEGNGRKGRGGEGLVYTDREGRLGETDCLPLFKNPKTH